MTVEEAISTLEAAGFVCEKLGGTDAPPRILGGMARVEGADGADGYVRAFSIHHEGDGWRLVWSGGQRGGAEPGTLDAAVAAARAWLNGPAESAR